MKNVTQSKSNIGSKTKTASVRGLVTFPPESTLAVFVLLPI